MKVDYIVTKDNGKVDLVLIQGNRCIRLYNISSDDLRAAASAVDNAL